jgi:hypothetical protein
MNATSRSSRMVRWGALAVGAAFGAYAAYAAIAWSRYGTPPPPSPEEADPLLDRFMAKYDIVERHRIRVHAPADVTLDAARSLELSRLALPRAIFKAREVMLGAAPDARPRPRALLAEMESLGWVVLAERPGREIVAGAVTRPWEADVVFRSIPAGGFAAFAEPGYVKIVWTLRADPDGPEHAIFRTETRAVATDREARARFRRYWSLLSPGIIVIRWATLPPVKAAAERRARQRPDAARSASGDRAPEHHVPRLGAGAP